MGLSINTNVAALNAYRNLSTTQGDLSKSLEKLSSGLRINRAADDAAGLSISEGLRSQVGGLKVAVRNAQDGISMVQTAEGALTEVHSILQRVRDLTVQGLNGSNNGNSLAAIDAEIGSLGDEIAAIGTRTKFNGVALFGASHDFQVGANSGDTLAVDMTTTNLATLSTTVKAFAAGTATGTDVDTSITAISTQRGAMGAAQNRLEHTINSLNVAVENMSASESRIRDTDMASEMVQFTRSQILSQAGTAMLAQAKSLPQGVLQLLQG